jgi:hypothetical protein
MSTLTDRLSQGPTKRSTGARSAAEIWFETLTPRDQQSILDAVNNVHKVWTTVELWEVRGIIIPCMA